MAKVDYVMARYRNSGSGALLAEALGVPCITPKFRPKGGWRKDNPVILNYGVSGFIKYANEVQFTNHPMAVYGAVRKDKALQKMAEVSVLYTTNPNEAIEWACTGMPIYARTMVAASKGNGIRVYQATAKDADPFVTNKWDADFLSDVKIFTRAPNKLDYLDEYRVHIAFGEVIDFAKKKKMGKVKREANGIEAVNPYIRSHDRGWVFTKKDLTLPARVIDNSKRAVACLELMHGAVDIIHDTYNNRAYVLEVNTAPGIEAQSTLEAYVQAFS